MATISTHNGSTVHQAHNRRDRHCTDKEKHIDPDGHFEVWRDIPIRKAYHELFDDAVKDYNSKQTRDDRKIKDYFKKIENDAKKHTAYEMIIGVYGDDVPEDFSRFILKDFFNNWEKRNPNLKLIGAYFHADEEGKQPHLHLDYIPISSDYQRGMKLQTGLVKALGEQGFHKRGKETAQIQWERSENKALEELCKGLLIKVEHPQAGSNIRHMNTKAYKAHQQLVINEKQLEVTETRLNNLKSSIDVAEQQKLDALRDRDAARVEKDISEAFKTAHELIDPSEDTEVISRTEAREKTILSPSKPATVTISESDFNRLEEARRAYENFYNMMLNFKLLEKNYRESAQSIYKNKLDAFRESYQADMQSKDRQIRDLQEKSNESRGLFKQYQSRIAELEDYIENLKETINDYEEVIREYPDEWQHMVDDFEKEYFSDYDLDFSR